MQKKSITIKLLSAMMSLSMCAMLVFSHADSSNHEVALDINNVGITKCWTGFCGHKSKTYDYLGYTVDRTYTNYYYTGFYLDPDATQTIEFTTGVSQGISVGIELGADVANASIGYSGEATFTASVSQSITNNKNYRRYAHLGVEMQQRTGGVSVGTLTYDPGKHITAVNRYCEYSYSTKYVTGTVATGCGLSLRTTIS